MCIDGLRRQRCMMLLARLPATACCALAGSACKGEVTVCSLPTAPFKQVLAGAWGRLLLPSLSLVCTEPRSTLVRTSQAGVLVWLTFLRLNLLWQWSMRQTGRIGAIRSQI